MNRRKPANRKIIIVNNTLHRPESYDDSIMISYEGLRRLVVRGEVLKHFLRYQEAALSTHRLETIHRPFLTALLLRLLSQGKCFFVDDLGRRQMITGRRLAKLFFQLVRDLWCKRMLHHRVGREIESLSRSHMGPLFSRHLDLSASPVYLRTELLFGVSSGGSVGHIAGVLNHLDGFTGKPIFLTTDTIPTVRRGLETHLISPGTAFWDFKELPSLFSNEVFEQKGQSVLRGRKVSFIYQRYSRNNYCGVKLAGLCRVPFVLEYNGSEIWLNRHWGEPLKYESISERIELLNLKAADVVVVVSQPMKHELEGRGIEAGKILVNPNGVDPDRYSPDVDGSYIRNQYKLRGGETVIGFIGTFGKWHGAEVLVEAFGRLVREYPTYRERVRLFMIGDGLTMPDVKQRLANFNVTDLSVLAGLIPQEEGPTHLAASDILVAPHVPNEDGTPFFGSPTKVFEYMAMGKGIVASDLDQIGDILEHDHTAWMVKPGDAGSLMVGMKTLIEDRQRRERLGQAARREVVAKYTWRDHTRRIIDKLKERCGRH